MPAQKPKHQRIYTALREEIRRGRWKPGERLPSEAQLVARFGVSRITVSRAMRDLQTAGLLHRRPGSGSFVAEQKDGQDCSFGLLIPNLGQSEFFEQVCQGMMGSRWARRHALVWGHNASPENAAQTAADSRADLAWQLCQQYVERNVSGVFFAPLEHAPDKDEVNERIVRTLAKARIPVVLLDRALRPFPAPPSHDLVGIDNRAAGHIMTEHLLKLGCQRVRFVSLDGAASTVADRESGFREALYARGIEFSPSLLHRLEGEADNAVQAIMRSEKPDGIVCANDRTAARLMHALRRLDYRIPQDVRIVGIDDADYASLLPVPLTTLRQPARRIGDIAIAVMLDRRARPDLPLRDVRLHCELIVRESCGAP